MLKDLEAKGVAVAREGDRLSISLSGDWSIYTDRPGVDEVLARAELPPGGGSLVVDCGEVQEWDSQLLVFLLGARIACQQREWKFRCARLPEGVDKLFEQVPETTREGTPEELPGSFFPRIGALAGKGGTGVGEMIRFIGEVAVSAVRVISNPRRFRVGDCFEAMQQTGAMALPIVGLISFLVGVIMAFQAAVQLRQFGAEVYVANLVGLAVVREMGPMMAAVVLCGRTGAAFAAQIGTMKVNEEIDALKTLGASPIDFLVMPRMVALFIMMPLLVIYANALGILGGLFVAVTVMDILPGSYMAQTRTAIDLLDVSTGLIKGIAFGYLIAFAGCLRGLQCKRSSAGVGAAATSAVVTGILLVIVADAIFAVVFERLRI